MVNLAYVFTEVDKVPSSQHSHRNIQPCLKHWQIHKMSFVLRRKWRQIRFQTLSVFALTTPVVRIIQAGAFFCDSLVRHPFVSAYHTMIKFPTKPEGSASETRRLCYLSLFRLRSERRQESMSQDNVQTPISAVRFLVL